MLALGHHPFQSNNEMKVSRIFTDVYQQNRLILLVNTIIEELERIYTVLNEDVFSIMLESEFELMNSGNPVIGSKIVITREYLSQYYAESYPKQPDQYQHLFAELVNLCNQFSFYIDSFMDIDFQTSRQESESDTQLLLQLLTDIRSFQRFSKNVLTNFTLTVQCSELKHSILYSSEISVETMIVIILLLGTLLYAAMKFFL